MKGYVNGTNMHINAGLMVGLTKVCCYQKDGAQTPAAMHSRFTYVGSHQHGRASTDDLRFIISTFVIQCGRVFSSYSFHEVGI